VSWPRGTRRCGDTRLPSRHCPRSIDRAAARRGMRRGRQPVDQAARRLDVPARAVAVDQESGTRGLPADADRAPIRFPRRALVRVRSTHGRLARCRKLIFGMNRDPGRLHRRDRRRHRLRAAGRWRARWAERRSCSSGGSTRSRASGPALYGRKLWETMSSYWPPATSSPTRPRRRSSSRGLRTRRGGVLLDRSTSDWNTRLVTAMRSRDHPARAEDGRPMGIGGATLAGAAMRAGLIGRLRLSHLPVLGAAARRSSPRWTAGEPEPGGDADVSPAAWCDRYRRGDEHGPIFPR